MNPSSTNPAFSILHVRTGPPRQVQLLAARLADRSLVVDACDDVYRALARLGRSEPDALAVVFVCVDDLLPMELEFFKFAKRLNGHLQIYVYGANGPRDRLNTAIELGADGIITNELLDELAGLDDEVASFMPSSSSEAAPRHAATSDSIEPAQTEPTPEPEPAGIPSPQPHASPALRIDDERAESIDDPAVDESHADQIDVEYDEPAVDEGAHEDNDEEDDMRPVRVPWLRYDQAPPRDPPDAAPRPNQWRPASPAQHDRSRPLLTEEEVRALMGEDFPEQEEPRQPGDDETSDGRKNREHD